MSAKRSIAHIAQAARLSASSATSSFAVATRQLQQQQQRQISTALIRANAASFRTPATRAPAVATTLCVKTWVGTRKAAGARGYSQDAPPAGEGKIWNFKDMKALTTGNKSDVVIVDVREPGELRDNGRIPGAVNVPISTQPDSFHISEDEFEDRFGYPRPAKDAEVVFYCKAGVRSRAAAQLARSAGWTKTGEYPGSWLDWVEMGGKIQR